MWENIPQELKFDALWCCWRKNEKGKVPYDVKNGTLAKSNDKSTFYSFKTILNYVQNYLVFDKNNAMLGGIGLGIFNGFSAIDIDHCVDENGVISDMAQDIIDYCQSYTEFSPSKTGIRIIFKTNLKNFDKTKYYTNNRKIGLEVYIEGATNKFVTITGNAVFPCDINEVDILYVLNKYMLKSATNNAIQSKTGNSGYADITKFLNTDTKLSELWNSQASGSGGNESEVDLALCSKLAFYLNKDADAIDTAFQDSPFFKSKDNEHKNKWLKRNDYRVNTINKAIELTTSTYNPNFYKSYDLTDTGNAHRFVDKFGENIRYNVDNECWMTWNGEYWQYDVFGNIKNFAEILIEEMKMEAKRTENEDIRKEQLKNIKRVSNSSGKEAMLKEAQHIGNMPVTNASFDTDNFLFNCKSGVIDLRTGKVLPHDKKYMCSKYSNIELGTEISNKFLMFLGDIFEDNQDIINFIQKAFGYALTGDMREQCMFILTGDGSNGKSLLLQIFREILGDYANTSKPELLVDSKYQSTNFSEVARLKDIRATIMGETKQGDRLNESLVKSLTAGNDEITARFLYKNEFSFYPKMKIFMATNYEPNIRGTDNGIWRRIIKIPFNRIFSEQEQDKQLYDKLIAEKSKILFWILRGCLKWQKEGLILPETLKKAKSQYKTDMDIVARWIDENCEVNAINRGKASELYQNFRNYCKNNGEYDMSQTLFGRNMAKKFKKIRAMGTYVYEGVNLK